MADPNQSDPDDDTYEPSTVEVNRAREQGLGVGQKDLDYQRDADEPLEEFSLSSDSQLEQDKKREALRKASSEQTPAHEG